MSVETFGETSGGQIVERIAIAGGGLTANIIGWGAALQDLRLAGHGDPLVLGFDTFEPYTKHSPYFGANVGRYANRIAGGRFTIDGQPYQTETNFLGKHTLHGGSEGTGRKVWAIRDHGADFVTLSCRAADGEMGFPGNLDIACTYSLKDDGRLAIEFTAETDAPTLCNLAHHSYFNLDDGGRTDVLDHTVRIEADAYLAVDEEAIPTGHVVPVDGTALDLRAPRPIRNDQGAGHVSYDHNFCLAAARGPLKRRATVRGGRSGVEMEVWTTEPGLQFYDGARAGCEVAGLGGVQYPAHPGLCLEPQIWPDAPNRPYFPQAILRPGEAYRQTTEYRFRVAA
ncbi:MAG: aldose epimerase family protein [Rhodomicrobiaceae bacterium]